MPLGYQPVRGAGLSGGEIAVLGPVSGEHGADIDCAVFLRLRAVVFYRDFGRVYWGYSDACDEAAIGGGEGAERILNLVGAP